MEQKESQSTLKDYGSFHKEATIEWGHEEWIRDQHIKFKKVEWGENVMAWERDGYSILML